MRQKTPFEEGRDNLNYSSSESSSNLDREIQQLHDLGFLRPQESFQSLNSHLHLSKLWAEVFWLRRKSHATREDPELQYVFKNNPRSILEIGSAYGRVLRKSAELNESHGSKAELTGVELCPHFVPYSKEYSSEYPILNSVKLIFEDFFTSEQLTGQTFDVILLPMNTFPSFPFATLPFLYRRVHDLLSDGGYFIFTTNKMMRDIYTIQPHHSGEILVREGQGPIIGEFYRMASQRKDYGAKRATYARYTKLTQDHVKKQSYLFRTIKELILPEVYNSLATENRFRIVFRDDSSHSIVYGLQPQPGG